MTLVFDATVGGSTANSYATTAALDDAFTLRPNSAWWAGLTLAQKQLLAMQATARLETEDWVGAMVTVTQRLRWPRAGVAREGLQVYDTITIPDPITYALAELIAKYYADDPTLTGASDDARAATGLEGIQSVGIGSLRVDFRLNIPGRDTLPIDCQRWLKPFRRAGGLLTRLVRA